MMMRVWRTKLGKLGFFLLLVVLCYCGYREYKTITMPPPLVILIPDTYFGPVFFLFGQPDGVALERDPLGNAVHVPRNGIVKIKDRVENALRSTSVWNSDEQRGLYMVSISASGSRKILKIDMGIQQDDDGSWWTGYLDETWTFHKIPFNHDTETRSSVFLLPESIRSEQLVMAQDTCTHQFGDYDDPKEKVTACGKFLVASPIQYEKMPNFMWEQLQHHFASVGQLVDEANTTAIEKRKFYKLP
jgi:nuclear transport factor 2 (NTF2) superfamily protein